MFMTLRMTRRSLAGARSSELAVGRHLHERSVEAQLHIVLPAQRLTRGEHDPDRILALDALAEKIVFEAECAHELHGLDQIGALRKGYRLARRIEHAGGAELGVKSGEIRAGELRHRLARGFPFFAG